MWTPGQGVNSAWTKRLPHIGATVSVSQPMRAQVACLEDTHWLYISQKIAAYPKDGCHLPISLNNMVHIICPTGPNPSQGWMAFAGIGHVARPHKSSCLSPHGVVLPSPHTFLPPILLPNSAPPTHLTVLSVIWMSLASWYPPRAYLSMAPKQPKLKYHAADRACQLIEELSCLPVSLPQVR